MDLRLAPAAASTWAPVTIVLESRRPYGPLPGGSTLVTQVVDLTGGNGSSLSIRSWRGDGTIADARDAVGLVGDRQARAAQGVLDALLGSNFLRTSSPARTQPLDHDGFRITVTDADGSARALTLPFSHDAFDDLGSLAPRLLHYGTIGYGELLPVS